MRDNTVRKILRRQRKDQLRQMRVLEELDTSAVFADSPVEIKEGYAVSDKETGELFLLLVFRSLSRRPIAALDIRLLLYRQGLPVPYRKDDFRYSWESATLGERVLDGQVRKEKDCKKERNIVHGEEFGQGVFLPLPDAFFHRLQIELVRVTYDDGGCESLRLVSDPFDRRLQATKFSEIDRNLHVSYQQMNIFDEKEESHPIRVLPQAGEHAWLCCCGHKNPAAASLCEACKREKDWQLANLSEEHLRQVRREMDADRSRHVPHDTSAFSQTRYLENAEDKQRKEAQFKQAQWELYVQKETDEARRYKKLIFRILKLALLVLAIMGVARLIMLGYELGIFVEAEESGILTYLGGTMR